MALTAGTLVPEFTMADRLRKAREYAGLDQAEMAAEIGISRASVGNYEQGHTRPRRPTLLAYAMRTGVSLDWIETGSVQPAGCGSMQVSGTNVRHLGERREANRARPDTRRISASDAGLVQSA